MCLVLLGYFSRITRKKKGEKEREEGGREGERVGRGGTSSANREGGRDDKLTCGRVSFVCVSFPLFLNDGSQEFSYRFPLYPLHLSLSLSLFVFVASHPWIGGGQEGEKKLE